MKPWERTPCLPKGGLVMILVSLFLGLGCGDNEDYRDDGPASAYRATGWTQLIGGPDAYGMPGDYILENGRIKVLVQDAGESFGPGLYGGSILDADRVRKGRETCCGHGLDQFVEVFPTANTMVAEVNDGETHGLKVRVTRDGSDGGPAIITVTGKAAPLLTILGGAIHLLDCTLLPALCDLIPLFPYSHVISFTIDYILEPGKDYVEIRTIAEIKDPNGEPIPAEVMDELLNPNMFLELIQGNLVFGDALFFGVDVDVFGPRFGYYLDGYVWRRLNSLLVKRKGRHLQPSDALRWSRDYFESFGLHRLRGTVRYPEAA